MKYKTLSTKEARILKKCDGDCVWGYIGEHIHRCKHCLGMKDLNARPVKFIKVGGDDSEFGHAIIAPTYCWKYLRFLCNKYDEKVWVK